MAMDEYIKREDALRQVLMVEKRENMYIAMKKIPAANVVERKSARWKGARLGDYYCSLCNETYSIGAERVKNWHYCPNCGTLIIE